MIMAYKVGAFVVNTVSVVLEVRLVQGLLTYVSHDGVQRRLSADGCNMAGFSRLPAVSVSSCYKTTCKCYLVT